MENLVYNTSGRARMAVVAGGGPVGAATAILLAQHGWCVQVLHLLMSACQTTPDILLPSSPVR